MKALPYETEKEWHALRADDVTSTESAALFGLSPYCSDFELWHRKKGNVTIAFEENQRMKWGRRFEDAIALGFGEDMDLTVYPMKDYYVHDKEPNMGCSCDYEALSGNKKIGLEIKHVDYLVYRDQWTDDEAPPHIEVQVQHQMEVMGWEFCYIVALVGGNDLKVIKRARDHAMGENIRQAIRQFWIGVIQDNPPEPDFDNDADFIISLQQKCGGGVLQDERFAYDFQGYDKAKARAKTADDIKKSIKARILMDVGEQYSKVEAGGFRLTCGVTKGSEGTEVTQDMVGTFINVRKPFRQFILNKMGAKKALTKEGEQDG